MSEITATQPDTAALGDRGIVAIRRGRHPKPLFRRNPDELRFQDYSLSDEQQEIVTTFSRFFAETCSGERIREAEPLGHDEALWREVAELGVVSMRLPEERGGIGLPLVDLTLVAQEAGRVAAPIPLAEGIATISLLARCADDDAGARLERAAGGSYVSTLALRPLAAGSPQLVPAGAVADGIVALDGDRLVLHEPARALPHVRNLASAPLAWWTAGDGETTVIAEGDTARDLHAGAVAEWRLLTAAALVGLGEFAIASAVDFVKTRLTSGTPLGALQGVAHPLADAQTKLVASRHLNWRAAWLHDREPGAAPELAPAAFVHADEAAAFAVATGLHMHGGFGFTTESDVSLYFKRAKGWSVVGEPARAVEEVGDLLAHGAA